ncbi:MAG: arginine--tRNA ligase, partial [Coriobacteriales bacterium]|nr:arginine--tRNA ligase [Coriobacteriales bacterium]
MRHAIARIVLDAIEAAAGASELKLDYTPETAVERPRDPANGDWATTVALRLAKELGRPPREIAQAIAAHIPTTATSIVAAVEVAGPGFINLRLSNDCLHQAVRDAHEQGRSYGRSNEGEGRTVNVEFVSANPTGPLHVGHGRWAALGNALANVLEHAGWQVTREFYINDAGVQMDVFGHSVALRYLELHGRTIEMPENSYGGSFVVDIAQHIKDEEGD